MNKQVVYTCITGGYDKLREPKFVSPFIDYVCFTDNAALTSKFWKIKQIQQDLKNLSNVKKQRLIKVLPHKYLAEYDVSLWIDSNISIVGNLKDFFAKYDLSKKFLYTNKHPGRDCIYREQLAVIRIRKDTFENTNPQIDRYRDEGFPEHYGLAETNIMLRAHKDQRCVRLMNLWGEEILKGSHRDQLSFDYCVWKLGLKSGVEYLDEKYFNLHLADNNFFALGQHIRMDKFKPFLDTREEESKKIAEEEQKRREEEAERQRQQEEAARKQEAELLAAMEKEKEERRNRDLPIVSVVLFTHDRTKVAIETIRSLVKNLDYPKLNWIVSDDRSEPGHVEELVSFFGLLGIVPAVCRTNQSRWGLGASMNNGLKEAFKTSDFALRCEDDWILEKKLDLRKHIQTMLAHEEVVGVRLGMVGSGVKVDEKRKIPGYKVLCGSAGENSWIFNNQVFLVKKKIHDAIGWYNENTTADKEEAEFKDRFNQRSDWGKKDFVVLAPSEMKWGTLDDPSLWFIHVGRSTLGHVIYREPKRYHWIYEAEKKRKAEQKKKADSAKGLSLEAAKRLIASTTPEKKNVEKETKREQPQVEKKEEKVEEKKEIVVVVPQEKQEKSTKKNTICVYTCITGNYDTLKPIRNQDPSIDFICFTDNAYIKAHPNGWIVRDVPKDLANLPKVKQQRLIKILPNVYLPEYSVSLWIDAVYTIVGSMKSLIERTIEKECSVYVRRHPDRNCIYKEAEAVVKLGKADEKTVAVQISKYREEGFPENFGLTETNMILRKHNDPECAKAMFLWAQEILTGSHRDQLSFDYCVWKQHLKIKNFSLVQQKFNNGYIEKRDKHNPSIVFYSTNFNTTKLENAMIKSIMKNVTGWNYKIVVIDNSDRTPFELDKDIDRSLVEVIDNTREQVIPTSFLIKNITAVQSLNNYASLRHAIVIQWIINNCGVDRFVLFDSDIILKKNIDFVDSKILTAAGIAFNGSKKRFTPFLQYFNVHDIKEKKIKYLDINRMHGGANPKNSELYDTGASFYEDVVNRKKKFRILNNDEYIEHLGGGSGGYRQNKRKLTVEEFLKKNEKYYV